MERRQELFVKNIQSEVQDTYSKIRYFFTVKLEKNWKRINEKIQTQKLSAEDFQKTHFFTQTLSENLRTHFKIGIMGVESVSEDYQKKFMLDFK